jgi:hypothetical protein
MAHIYSILSQLPYFFSAEGLKLLLLKHNLDIEFVGV